MSAPRHGAVSASYTTYIRSPVGEIAGAVYNGRSPASDAVSGALHVDPPSSDQLSCVVFALMFPSLSAHASTISFVAPIPVGAPFAMSTLGAAERSVLAPAKPSMTHRPYTGSVSKHGSVICRRTCIFVHDLPPSNDLNSTWNPCVGSPTSVGFWNISA